MGLFWAYFRDQLRLPQVLKSGPLAMLAEGAAGLLDTGRDIMTTLRDQFFPARCEEAYLARFARSRGIVRNPLEPLNHWHARVRFAYKWWAAGGRASAMAEALSVGFDLSCIEILQGRIVVPLFDETSGALLFDETSGALLTDDPSDSWAEFRVIAYAAEAQTYTGAQIIWAINEVKPARSLLAGLEIRVPLFDETTGAPLFDETTGGQLTS